jgi:hypothetical protein
MIRAELVGGAHDGALWELPDSPDNPRPDILVAVPAPVVFSPEPTEETGPTSRVGVFRLVFDATGHPSRNDAGVFRYRWAGVR